MTKRRMERRNPFLRHLILGGALFAAPFFAGCKSFSTVPMYAGERLPPDQVAKISPTPGWDTLSSRLDTFILAVDGKDLDPKAIDEHASVEVLPGMHAIAVAAMLERGGQRIPFKDPKPLEFVAEAGEEYLVKARAAPGPEENQTVVRIWVEDSSGETVIGAN